MSSLQTVLLTAGNVLSMGALLLFLHSWSSVSCVRILEGKCGDQGESCRSPPPTPPSPSPSQVGCDATGYCGRPSLLLPHHEVPAGVWRPEVPLHPSVPVGPPTLWTVCLLLSLVFLSLSSLQQFVKTNEPDSLSLSASLSATSISQMRHRLEGLECPRPEDQQQEEQQEEEEEEEREPEEEAGITGELEEEDWTTNSEMTHNFLFCMIINRH